MKIGEMKLKAYNSDFIAEVITVACDKYKLNMHEFQNDLLVALKMITNADKVLDSLCTSDGKLKEKNNGME